ncbi:MAG: TadE/TadG family type IV pilus assembly protein [Nocardioides sp.]
MSRVPPSRDERGSLAIELAMIAPGLLLLLALIYAYGRVGQVNGLVESGTRDAARSATIARSETAAGVRAEAVVREAIAAAPSGCRSTLQVRIVGGFEPGEPVTVVSSCRYSLSDLGLPGAPGSVRASSSFTSMLDPYRGVD